MCFQKNHQSRVLQAGDPPDDGRSEGQRDNESGGEEMQEADYEKEPEQGDQDDRPSDGSQGEEVTEEEMEEKENSSSD